jgi:hypothetical protein
VGWFGCGHGSREACPGERGRSEGHDQQRENLAVAHFPADQDNRGS